MNLNEKVKHELCKIKYEQGCCKLASLSSFVRTAGSIIAEDNKYGFSVSTNPVTAEYYAEITQELYGVHTVFNIGGKSAISGFTVLENDSLSILMDLGIVKITGEGITIALEPDEYLVENECCKLAYVRGAFLGGGSLTVPDVNSKKGRTGYHLEFVFSKYLTAQHFSSLLGELGFFPKLIERKNSFIVYFKQHEEIKDLLAYMGANSAVFEFSDLVIMRDVKNNTNRITNCEISNVNKQVEASLKQCNAIKLIAETIGLEALSPELEKTAKARLKYSDYPLSDLADMLNISKSCLNHRLRKLVAIAESIK
ncbi:MAG: DNA-binding protein WhiA [Clostridiales bacterium]|nr:DNA-binding protein WhiA [Clostridiales bacterium]